MRLTRIAVRTLLFERGKFLVSVASVAFSTMLVLCNVGIYLGFELAATAVITHSRGDVWVMAAGTRILDFADTLSPGVGERLAAHPCVKDVRGLLMTWSRIRRPSGGIENVQLIGVDRPTAHLVPWTVSRGLPADLVGPDRIALDSGDLERLEIRGAALGHPVELGDRTVHLAVLTRGIRSFTLSPYVFAELSEAQSIARVGREVNFYLLDLASSSCTSEVLGWVPTQGDLLAMTRPSFERSTATYWLTTSGAGAALGFSTVLGFLVGLVVVGQTLFALTEGRLRELATLKVMGASSLELLRIVLVQASLLGALGGALGLGMSLAARALAGHAGLTVVLSMTSVLAGVASVFVMCGVAALLSGRRVLRVPASEVFQ